MIHKHAHCKSELHIAMVLVLTIQPYLSDSEKS